MMIVVIVDYDERHGSDFGVGVGDEDDDDAAMLVACVVAGIRVAVVDCKHGPLSWDYQLILTVILSFIHQVNMIDQSFCLVSFIGSTGGSEVHNIIFIPDSLDRPIYVLITAC
jgi:hypothetical protein